MSDQERRRQSEAESAAALKARLTPEQRTALATLEQFQWNLRRPMFQEAVAVLVAADGQRFVVLEVDGSINENPGFKIRP